MFHDQSDDVMMIVIRWLLVIGYCNKEGDDQASYEIQQGVPSLELGYFHMEFGEETK